MSTNSMSHEHITNTLSSKHSRTWASRQPPRLTNSMIRQNITNTPTKHARICRNPSYTTVFLTNSMSYQNITNTLIKIPTNLRILQNPETHNRAHHERNELPKHHQCNLIKHSHEPVHPAKPQDSQSSLSRTNESSIHHECTLIKHSHKPVYLAQSRDE